MGSLQPRILAYGLLLALLGPSAQAQEPKADDPALVVAALKAELARVQQAHAADKAKTLVELQAAVAKAVEAVEATPEFKTLQALRKAVDTLRTK